MTRWIEYSAWLWGALACAAALVAIVRARGSGESGHCVGNDVWWTAWILPWHWFGRVGCGYNLRGLAAGSDGTVRCPECGSRVKGEGEGAWMLMLAAAGPWLRMALVAILAGACCWNVRWIRRGGWARYTPTALLSVTTGGLTDWTPPGVQGELDRRLKEDEPSRLQRLWIARAAIRNLGDDSADWNASWARGVLWRIGDDALPEIERALDSPDYQRRQLAADILRNRWRGGEHAPLYGGVRKSPYRPPDRLFEVTVEGLRSDSLDRGQTSNAYNGFAFLVRQPERAGAFLDAGLGSDDAQQVRLCALVAGLIGEVRLIDRAAPILIERLRTSSGRHQAVSATRALYCFGNAALPYVKPWTASDDRRLAQLTRLIEVDLETPGAPIARRRSLNQITHLVEDPATDLTLEMIREMRP